MHLHALNVSKKNQSLCLAKSFTVPPYNLAPNPYPLLSIHKTLTITLLTIPKISIYICTIKEILFLAEKKLKIISIPGTFPDPAPL